VATPLTSVELLGMQNAHTDFEECLAGTTASYNMMHTQIEAAAASWSGDAASTYQVAMQSWLEDFSKVNAALNRMLETLATNRGVYAQTHAATQDDAARLRSQMSGGISLPGF
jgi:WXG100 family type VII secretion target